MMKAERHVRTLSVCFPPVLWAAELWVGFDPAGLQQYCAYAC